MKHVEEISLQVNPACEVCQHPQRMVGAIMRDMHANMEEIAASLQLDVDQVERHFEVCVPRIAGIDDLDNPAGASDAQLALLLQHSLELFHAAGLTGNMVASASACQVRLRTLVELGRRAEAKSKNQGEILSASPEDCSTWSPELGEWVRRYQDSLISQLNEVESRRVEMEEA